jgi:hypothetical protein
VRRLFKKGSELNGKGRSRFFEREGVVDVLFLGDINYFGEAKNIKQNYHLWVAISGK